jgi:acetolactate synthase-1/2/3 large subunit
MSKAESSMSFDRPSDEQTVAAYAVDLIVRLGASTVFSLTGGMAMYLNRAVASHSSLKAVYCHHEQACVNAAEGYAKAHDFARPGFAVVTSGPGVTNTITSLCSAYGDSAPVIVLAGQVKTEDIDSYGTRTHGAQEVRSLELVRPCVKSAVRLDFDTARDTLANTLAEAFRNRPGPVFIEIPLDVQNRPLAYTRQDLDKACAMIRADIASEITPSAIERLADCLDWISKGQRPLVYVGNGCRIANIGSALRDWLMESGVPVVHSWLTTDLVDGPGVCNLGAPGGLAPIWSNRLLYAADRILFLGARLDLGTTAFQRDAFGAQAARRIVDVDPAELSKFAHVPGVEGVPLTLWALPAAIDIWRGRGRARHEHSDWRAQCVTLMDVEAADERRRLSVDELNVYGVAQALSSWREPSVFVPTGSGAAIEAFIRFFRPPVGGRCFFSASLGAMGLGLPQAIGAAFDQTERVICIEGDGGIMLNIQELATLAHHSPPGFVLFILNNDGYASIANSQLRHFGHADGAGPDTGVFIPDFAALAAAFGLAYTKVSTLKALRDLIPTLSRKAPPIIVDLHVNRAESRGPTVKTLIDADGQIRSTSLADIAW